VTFPTTGTLDDFNRANTGPPPSSNWSTDVRGFGDQGMKVASNVCVPNSGASPASTWWNPGTFAAAQECLVKINALLTSGQNAGLFARIVGPGGAGPDSYQVDWLYSSGATDTIAIQRMDNGVFTQLGASISQDFSAGDSIGIECNGSTIAAYRKPSAGSWGSIGNRTDSTYSAAGYIGMYFESAAGSFEDFGGGAIVADPFPPVPGVVQQQRRSPLILR